MMVIAIDFDGTAEKFPGKVRALYNERDNFIVIYTARPEKMRNETRNQLIELDIPYHALVMGKMRADVYVDDHNCGGLSWPI